MFIVIVTLIFHQLLHYLLILSMGFVFINDCCEQGQNNYAGKSSKGNLKIGMSVRERAF